MHTSFTFQKARKILKATNPCVLTGLSTSERQEPSCSGQEVKVTSSKFSGNHHTGDGGMLYVDSASSLILQNTDFTDTSCTGYGGHTYGKGIGSTTYERVCTALTYSSSHGQSEAFWSIKGPVIQSLCSFTFSPNNQAGLFNPWHMIMITGDNHKASLTSTNISHSDFPLGRGSVLSCQQSGNNGRIEFTTLACNRLCCLNYLFNGELSKSNVINNSQKATASIPVLFWLDSSNKMACSDTIFVSNHFSSLLYNNIGTLNFTNSFFFDSELGTTSVPMTEPMPTTRALSYACMWDERNFTESSPSIKEMLMKLVLFIVMLG